MLKTSLYYNDLARGGTSDKEYNVQVEPSGAGYVVNFQFGRRGGTLQSGTKTKTPVTLAEANGIFTRLVAEKMGGNYKPGTVNDSAVEVAASAELTEYPVELLEEVGAEEVAGLLESPRYWLQMKADGHRRQIKKVGASITGYNKKGQPVALQAELAKELKRHDADDFLLDGEIIGNKFIAYDLLIAGSSSIAAKTYEKRFHLLTQMIEAWGVWSFSVIPTWRTRKEKTVGYAWLKKLRCEGAVFKLHGAAYQPGVGEHKKFKFIKSATCKVIEVGVGGKNNAALALLDGARWVEVGCASTIGKGKIAVGDIVEVLFLYATDGRRLYQPRIKEVRDDVDAKECTIQRQLPASVFKQGAA